LFAIVLTIIILFSVLFGAGGGIIGWLPFALSGETALLTVSHPVLATIMFIILLTIPLIALIYGIIAYFIKPKPLHVGIKWAIFVVWLLAFVLFLSSGFHINREELRNNSNWYCWDWRITSGKTIVRGNGIIREKEYFIPPVDYVSIDDDLIAHLQIEQIAGDSVSILISGDENLIDKIRHRVHKNGLYLSTWDNYRFRSDSQLIIRIQTPSLKRIRTEAVGNISINKPFLADELKIEMESSGILNAESLMVQSLKVDLEGVGTIRLAGYAERADFKMEGSGEIDAAELVSKIVLARLEGVGKIRCNPVDYLDAKVLGIGKISYKNEPARRKRTRMVGIGSIGME
jgi:hypothetical protein